MCACGEPLHYTNFENRLRVERMIELSGGDQYVIVRVLGGKRYRVQRHYIALHGLNAAELPELAKRGIVMEVIVLDE